MPTHNQANHRHHRTDPPRDPGYPPVDYYARQEREAQEREAQERRRLDMISFSTGIPSGDLIFVEGYGFATFVRHHENGGVDIYIGSNRTMTVPDETRWRYAK